MKVLWSELAKIDYWKNIEYLEQNWTSQDVMNFITKVEEAIDLLETKKISFQKKNYRKLYKFVIVKQIMLYYLMDNPTIVIIRFWNNYQDLKSFKIE